MLCANTVKTIAFSTTNWGKNDKFVEKILNEMKYQFETKQFSNRCWKILFIFDDKQSDLFDEFSQVILALQTETDDYEQFLYSITSM